MDKTSIVGVKYIYIYIHTHAYIHAYMHTHRHICIHTHIYSSRPFDVVQSLYDGSKLISTTNKATHISRRFLKKAASCKI